MKVKTKIIAGILITLFVIFFASTSGKCSDEIPPDVDSLLVKRTITSGSLSSRILLLKIKNGEYTLITYSRKTDFEKQRKTGRRANIISNYREEKLDELEAQRFIKILNHVKFRDIENVRLTNIHLVKEYIEIYWKDNGKSYYKLIGSHGIFRGFNNDENSFKIRFIHEYLNSIAIYKKNNKIRDWK